MSVGAAVQRRLDRIQGLALMAGAGGLLISLGGALIAPRTFLPPYLVAYLFWVGLAVGCVALTMLHHLVGGTWGLLIRRPLEAGAMALMPMLVFFIPLLLGVHALYRWSDTSFVEHHEAVRQKLAYLNSTAWAARALGYFVFWLALAVVLNRLSVRQDSAKDTSPTQWAQWISGPGLALTFLTGTFAAIDWAMSLEPEWYSTIYSAMVIVGWGLETFAFIILVAAWLTDYEPMSGIATPTMFQDLGNLMLAFVMLWAYMSFSQFLIIWSGNLVEEIPWYLRRVRGGWQWVALALILFHFFVPFFLLLFRDMKLRPHNLMGVAGVILAVHVLNLAWLVLPAQYYDWRTTAIPWGSLLLVPVALIGIGGIWIWVFLWSLKGQSLIPLNSPEIKPWEEHQPGG
jgi:hypothetical protein